MSLVKSPFAKTLFNVVFLLFNVIILLTNYNIMGRPKRAAYTDKELKSGPNSAEVVVPHIDGQRSRHLSALEANRPGKLMTGLAAVGAAQTIRPGAAQRPVMTWDRNWDSRQVAAVLEGSSKGGLRRIWLVRHGNYYTKGDHRGHLTDMGKGQIENLAKRIKGFGVKFDTFFSSTSIRARETSEIISKYLPGARFEYSDLLKEGQPGFPHPEFPVNIQKDKSFEDDHERLEKGFKKYISRGETKTERPNTNDLIVTHGNVIGYFTLRGLQVPSERWLKVQVIQGSISMYEITRDGHFNLRILGDMGHIAVGNWTG